jgi:hypothetical protein
LPSTKKYMRFVVGARQTACMLFSYPFKGIGFPIRIKQYYISST